MISLCKFCNSSKKFSEGECYICGGKFDKIDELIEEAAGKIDSDFSVSTRIPKKWLEKEELLFDFHLTESIKSTANRYINRKLHEKTGKDFGPEMNLKVVFDIDKGEVSVEPNELFIFGRYQKLVPGISQTRWTCKNCNGKGCKKCEGKGKMYVSVEEKIGKIMKEEADAKDYTLHASGREDIDVVTTAKRPFVMQFGEAKNRKPDLKKIEKTIADGKEVAVHDLKIVKRGAIELVAASHFDKEYEAEIEFEGEPNEKQIETVLSLEGKTIDQKTPERVAHRRANLIRRRKILSVKLVSKEGNKAKFRIKTEAGTYIKELITGDEGRTEPNFSSLSGMKTKCANLKVVEIEDEFLKETIG